MDRKGFERRVISMPLQVGPLRVRGPKFDVMVRNESIEDAIGEHPSPLPSRESLGEAADGFQSKGVWLPRQQVAFDLDDGWIRYVYKTYSRCYIDLRGGFDEYRKRFSSKALYNLRRQRRIYFEKNGLPEGLFIARSAESLDEFARRALVVSKTTYQETVFGAGLPAGDEYLRTMRAVAADGRMRGYVLAGPDGRDAAYMYCVVEDGNVLCKYIGYDPATSRYSPGSTLLLMAIESLLAEGGLKYFDFGEGDAQYKRLFSTGSTPCGDLLQVRMTAGSAAWLRLHRMFVRVMGVVSRFAASLHLKDAMRRFTRRLRPGREPLAEPPK